MTVFGDLYQVELCGASPQLEVKIMFLLEKVLESVGFKHLYSQFQVYVTLSSF